MNGRLYDPALHRFLQPGNYIQDPFNTQNFNRYGYCLNNPLVYVDENGEFIITALIVGVIIGAYAGGLAAAGLAAYGITGGVIGGAVAWWK